MNHWFEDLPEQCPPDDALAPTGQIYYRLVNDLNKIDVDLLSQRYSAPKKKFSQDECICCAVSLFKNIEDCENITKLPRHKDKKVLPLKLVESDGLIKQTFKPSHHSWWRSSKFVLENE